MIPAAPAGAVRFNPPPGWGVPVGFDPRRGHLPDPTWSPPPPDWEFWVPDSGAGRYPSTAPSTALPPGPGAPRERRRVLLAVVAVLVALGVAIWWGAANGSSGPAVGSCWTGVEGGEMEEVPCGSSRATHQIEDRVSDVAECSMTSTGYFEDGNAFLCVKRLG